MENLSDIRTIGVVGSGVMGSGIAQVASQAGYEVLLHDLGYPMLQIGLNRIRQSLARDVERGVISQDSQHAVLNRIHTTTQLKVVATSSDIIIEAVVENQGVKNGIFLELDKLCPEHVILASNTSSISITKLATGTHRPTKVVGMHFFNPAPKMKLIEVIRGDATSDETIRTICRIGDRMEKVCIQLNETPGFVVNRLLVPMINEAATLLGDGVASAEDIDNAMKIGAHHPMGPLALADLIGLDVLVPIMEILEEELADPHYGPCLLLRRMVQEGHLGRKSGNGFYYYPESR